MSEVKQATSKQSDAKPQVAESIPTPYGILLGAAIGIVLVIPLVHAVSFVFFFHQPNVSPSTADWASYSTYFGELANPLLTFVTFVFLYFNYKNERSLRIQSEKVAEVERQNQLKENQDREKRIQDENAANLLLTKCERIETKLDELWTGFQRGYNPGDFWMTKNNPKRGGENTNIWGIADDLNLICQLCLALLVYDPENYYPEYLVKRYLGLFSFLEQYGYDREEGFVEIFIKKYLR